MSDLTSLRLPVRGAPVILPRKPGEGRGSLLYFFGAFFLPAIAFRFPLWVRAFVWVR
jgi:hypothetical protein